MAGTKKSLRSLRARSKNLVCKAANHRQSKKGARRGLDHQRPQEAERSPVIAAPAAGISLMIAGHFIPEKSLHSWPDEDGEQARQSMRRHERTLISRRHIRPVFLDSREVREKRSRRRRGPRNKTDQTLACPLSSPGAAATRAMERWRSTWRVQKATIGTGIGLA